MTSAPDVVILGPEWPERALLRAQLIEEGYEVVATEGWPIPRQFLRADTKPRALVVDLRGLPEPRPTLDEIAGVMPAGRVLVLTALGTVPADDVRRLGFQVITRPASVHDVVMAVGSILAADRVNGPGPRA